MQKSKFIYIIRTFSREELKQFRDFLHSPFHNTNKNVIRVYELIKKCAPEFDLPAIEKEKLFYKIYPGKKYNDTVMRILSSDLLSLAEEFLSYSRFLKDAYAGKRLLLLELKDRKLDGLFNKHIKEAENIFEKAGSIDENYFLNRFELESAKVDFLISGDRQDESGVHLLKTGEYLINFFVITLLNITQELSEHEEVLNEKFDFQLASEFLKNTDLSRIMDYMKANNYEYRHVIEIYYYINKCSDPEAGDKYYGLLKSSVEKNLGLFGPSERYNLFLALESCCITLMRHNGGRDYNDLMEVYELALANEAFSNDNRQFMQANLFRNIFYTSVVLKRFDWAEKFVNDFYKHLLPNQRTDMFNYTNAILNFERKNYSEALEQIAKVNYGFFVFKYEAKSLMLKLLYELRSFEQALSVIDSFSHFLAKNKKVSEVYRRQFMNFVKHCRVLIKKSRDGGSLNGADIAEMKKQIGASQDTINKKWLLEKAEELKKN